MRALLVVALLFHASGDLRAAEIYRCEGESGEVLFSGRPCGSPIALSTERPEGVAQGLRASEREWLAARDARRAPAPRRARETRSGRGNGRSDKAYQCRRKRSQLEALNAQMRRGYKPGRGEKLRRRRSAYEDYLAAFCS
ncbi:MAG: hypothetical protein KDJ33_06770 [Gammaproteobacteria bacterium]|nr:hypothetical protein [Gammaproteobacteria bacterium]